MNIGKTIAELRKAKGLSQLKLAAATGLTGTGIVYIETGRTVQPNKDSLERIATALGVSVGALVFLSIERTDARHPLVYDSLYPQIRKAAMEMFTDGEPVPVEALAKLDADMKGLFTNK